LSTAVISGVLPSASWGSISQPALTRIAAMLAWPPAAAACSGRSRLRADHFEVGAGLGHHPNRGEAAELGGDIQRRALARQQGLGEADVDPVGGREFGCRHGSAKVFARKASMRSQAWLAQAAS
jgi:hypothetical protein